VETQVSKYSNYIIFDGGKSECRNVSNGKRFQFNRHKYKCHDCGHEFTAKDVECPQKGRFGVNLLVYLIMLKFSLRGVLLRRIKDFAFHLNAFEITLKGIQDAILRVGAACKTVNPLHQPFTKDHHITLQSIKREAITMPEVVILAICFEGDITFVISELKAKVSLREFTSF